MPRTNTNDKNMQRAPFLHGDDCTVTFLKQRDNTNAYVDLFEISSEYGSFSLQMMKMKYKNEDDPWVFGSFHAHGKTQGWSFKEDVRVQDDEFRGDLYTYVHNGVTYVLYVQHGILHYVVPFVQMLDNPSFDPDGEGYDGSVEDMNLLHEHYALMQNIALAAGLIFAEDVQEVLDHPWLTIVK